MDTDVYAEIATKIIESQEAIIGPVAIEQAEQIPGIKLAWGKAHTVQIAKDGADTIDALVKRYQNLFGQISVEVSREAAHTLIGKLEKDELPQSLK